MSTAFDINDPLSIIRVLGPRLDNRQHEYLQLQNYYEGDQPLSFIAPEISAQLNNRLDSLVINWASLIVNTIAERLVPLGYAIPGKKTATKQVNQIWQNNNLDEQVQQALIDTLVFGRSYAIVWGDKKNKATVSLESAKNMIAYRDPATRLWTAALKRWVEDDGRAYAVVYTPDKIWWCRSKTKNADTSDLYASAEQVTDLSGVPANGWEVTDEIVNPLGQLNVVVLANRPLLTSPEGTSELSDVIAMADAVNKMATDMMVTSEFYATPRRWATGVELEERMTTDDEGEDVIVLNDNFDTGKAMGRWNLFEDTAAKVGQFPEAELANFIDGIDMLGKYIAAVKKIPAHYFDPSKSGLASAEAVRAAEAPLVVMAKRMMLTIGGALEQVGRLALMVESDDMPTASEMRMETLWQDPENLTQAQKVDAATKRAAIGVPTEQLWRDAGYTEQQIEDMKDMLALQQVNNNENGEEKVNE